jgi:hypothetical protein
LKMRRQGTLAPDIMGIRSLAMTKRLEIGYLPEGTLLYSPSIFFFPSHPCI